MDPSGTVDSLYSTHPHHGARCRSSQFFQGSALNTAAISILGHIRKEIISNFSTSFSTTKLKTVMVTIEAISDLHQLVKAMGSDLSWAVAVLDSSLILYCRRLAYTTIFRAINFLLKFQIPKSTSIGSVHILHVRPGTRGSSHRGVKCPIINLSSELLVYWRWYQSTETRVTSPIYHHCLYYIHQPSVISL